MKKDGNEKTGTDQLHTPVLFIVFNRPALAEKTFNVIRSVRPKKLFIVADGPRDNVESDIDKCQEVRRLADRVDWDCQLEVNFFEKNQGCGVAPSKGITWFFNHVPQGIILEDDCLPDPSFFKFCEELLEYYKDEPRVMHINGNNYNTDRFSASNASYHFGSYPQAWGWASWRRAWEHFQFHLDDWPNLRKQNGFEHMGWFGYEQRIQRKKYDDLFYSGRTDIWDYQWHYAVFKQRGLTIVPKVNLVSNIGFGDDATHTFGYRKQCTELETAAIRFPLVHPERLEPDGKVDMVYREIMIGPRVTLYSMIRRKLIRYASRIARLLIRPAG